MHHIALIPFVVPWGVLAPVIALFLSDRQLKHLYHQAGECLSIKVTRCWLSWSAQIIISIFAFFYHSIIGKGRGVFKGVCLARIQIVITTSILAN